MPDFSLEQTKIGKRSERWSQLIAYGPGLSKAGIPASAITQRSNGAIYTPPLVADYLASKLIEYFLKDYAEVSLRRRPGPSEQRHPQILKILDPACGSGELLVSVWQQLSAQLWSTNGGARFHPSEVLCGIDIDQNAIRHARYRIRALPRFSMQTKPTLHVLRANALFPLDGCSSADGWDNVLRKFKSSDGFDIVIANPPWGADVKSYKSELERDNFALCQGQFDTSDLFLELSLKLLRPDGYLGFIVPDSLFSYERAPLRKMLLEQTEIRFIARLGEKLFEGINRACAIIICKKSREQNALSTKCLRLTPSLRKQILESKISFKYAERLLSHSVSQQRFLKNRNYLFDIDVTSREKVTLRPLEEAKSTFGDFLISGRGIELSKTGRVYQCTHCRLWLPLPNTANRKCPHCKIEISILPQKTQRIVSKEICEGYAPLIVGENIKRYKVQFNWWIDVNKEGINYKNKSAYLGPKLLVRKTGVGISAAIDYSTAYTNQVVYIFRLKDDVPQVIPLELFLAILNSRAIYYYLTKNHGETEWRSHPYLTQKQILNIPSPDARQLENGNRQRVQQMVDLLSPFTKGNLDVSSEVDAKLERMVAELFGLNRNHYEAIYRTLDEVEELLPVRVLKNISIADIFEN